MEAPLLMIAVIVATGLVLVVIPVALDSYQRFPRRKVLVCPDTHQMAEVMPKAWDAALKTALARKPSLRVKWCSLWPKKMGCDGKVRRGKLASLIGSSHDRSRRGDRSHPVHSRQAPLYEVWWSSFQVPPATMVGFVRQDEMYLAHSD